MTLDDQIVRQLVADGATLRSAVLEEAARHAGLRSKRLDERILLLELSGYLVPFSGLSGPDTNQVVARLCTYRDAQRRLLQDRGNPLPRWAVFSVSQREEALRLVDELGGSVDVRSARPTRGRHETLSVFGRDEFESAWSRAERAITARSGTGPILIEESLVGTEYRVLVVDREVVAVSRISAPSVVGDGRATVEALIKRKNKLRAENPYVRRYPVAYDPDDVVTGQRGSLYELGSVPATGERVVLGRECKVTAGADIVDVTDAVDADCADTAISAVESLPGLSYGEVRVVVPEVDRGIQRSSRAVVLHVECLITGMSRFPTHGQARDVGGAVLSHYGRAPTWTVAQQVPGPGAAVGTPLEVS